MIGKKLVKTQGTTESDFETKKTREQVTIDILRQAANMVMPFLEFTAEVSHGETDPVACLDSQLYYGKVRGQKKWFRHEKVGERPPGCPDQEEHMGVLYKFYKKKVANHLTILNRSAMPEKVKIATFSSEIIRRLKTTSIHVSQMETEEILTNLMDDLAAMGYNQDWRENILKSALKGYMRVLDKVEKGEVKRNRKGVDSMKQRRFKKLLGIREWYRVERETPDAWEVTEPWEKQGIRATRKIKRQSDSRYIESVFFVPHTPGGALRHVLTKLEESLKFRTRFKYIEEMGRSAREMVVQKDQDP